MLKKKSYAIDYFILILNNWIINYIKKKIILKVFFLFYYFLDFFFLADKTAYSVLFIATESESCL